MFQIHSRVRYNLPFIFLMLAIIVLTAASDTVSVSVRNSLELCHTSIIPSLFPFMVLSAIATKITSVLITDVHHNTAIIIPFILGALCGFPVGAASVATLYENGIIPKRKAEYFCALCNNTGPAFIIGVIGKNFWHSSSIGILLYICQILSSAAIFFLWLSFFDKRVFCFKTHISDSAKTKNRASSANADFSFCTTFCSSVKQSSLSVIKVCGFIIFFKMLCDIIRSFFSLKIPLAILSSLLEFTTGSLDAAEVGGTLGICLCGFSVGFSGLSVIAQSADFMHSVGLSALPLIRLKFFAGILCGIVSGVFYNLFNFSEYTFYQTTYYLPPYTMVTLTPVIVILAIFFYFIKKSLTLINRKRHRIR